MATRSSMRKQLNAVGRRPSLYHRRAAHAQDRQSVAGLAELSHRDAGRAHRIAVAGRRAAAVRERALPCPPPASRFGGIDAVPAREGAYACQVSPYQKPDRPGSEYVGKKSSLSDLTEVVCVCNRNGTDLQVAGPRTLHSRTCSRCGGSFNPEPAATAQHADTVAVGSGLNDLKTTSAQQRDYTPPRTAIS